MHSDLRMNSLFVCMQDPFMDIAFNLIKRSLSLFSLSLFCLSLYLSPTPFLFLFLFLSFSLSLFSLSLALPVAYSLSHTHTNAPCDWVFGPGFGRSVLSGFQISFPPPTPLSAPPRWGRALRNIAAPEA